MKHQIIKQILMTHHKEAQLLSDSILRGMNGVEKNTIVKKEQDYADLDWKQ